MRQVIDISWQYLALGYLLMLVPLSVIFLYKLRIMSSLLISMLRMTIQLLFVGFYLHFVFDLDYWWLNVAWMLVMVLVADLSIISRCRLRLGPFLPRLFLALIAGISVPLLFFLGWIWRKAMVEIWIWVTLGEIWLIVYYALNTMLILRAGFAV